MKWFTNLSIKNKIIVVFLLIILCLIGIMGLAFNEFRGIQKNQRTISDKNYKAVIELSNLNKDINHLRTQIYTALIFPNNPQNRIIISDIKERVSGFKNTAIKLGLLLAGNDKYAKDINELQTALEYYETNEIEGLRLIEEGKIDSAKTLINSRSKDWLTYVQNLSEKITSDTQNEVDVLLSANNENLSELIYTFAIFISIIILVTFFVGWQTNKTLGKPIKELADNANKISEGDLTIEMPETKRKDEIGVLTNSFMHMLESLRDLTSQLTDSSVSVSESANLILQNTTNLASSASETATAISETSVTVSQAREATNLSNQKTREVSERSQASASIAERGRKATQETVHGMQKIGNDMNTIANAIVKLSEKSKAIGEIISSVNDIAEQSNLLAVNAAIEAARAGEHGKGFVVVAHEIKTLAEQSKEATSQVKSILNEIQDSINSSVLSTEQGSKTVELGVALAEQSGKAIDELSTSINLAAEAAIQIAASSQEQGIGMDQIATAMENIKTASNQNASATKQLENSARALQNISVSLKNMLSHFKV